MKIEFFVNVDSIETLKAQFKKLAFKNHPDRGGSTENMQKINAEYDFLMKQIINGAGAEHYTDTAGKQSFWESKTEHTEVELKVKAALDAIISLDGLEIEIIGVWIWVSGDTKTHKEVLKTAGFRWNKTLVKWVFMGKKSNGRGTMSMDEMREKYGSEKVGKKVFEKISC